MAIDKGNIKTSANYDVKAQKPLDGRAVRPAKADLIKKESWSSDGNTVYVYEGMQVYVEDEKKTYYLKDLSKMFAADFSGWELMGTGAAAEIEVDTELSETSENAIANSTVSRALAEKQERLMDGINIKTVNGQNILGGGNIEIEGGGGGSSVEVVDSLDSEDTTAALSANQGRVLKEMIEELPSGGGGTAAEGTKVYPIYWSTGTEPISEDEQKANKEAYDALIKGEPCLCVSAVGMTRFPLTPIVIPNMTYIQFNADLSTAANDGGIYTMTALIAVRADGSVLLSSQTEANLATTEYVDNAVANSGGGGSDTSTNAVSNKVIKEYVDNAAPHQFGEDFSEDFN